MRLIDDPRLATYDILDQGFTALVTGTTGSGKTLSFRPLIEAAGADRCLVIATDPRLLPLAGLGVKVLRCWVEPGTDGAQLKAEATAAWQVLQEFMRDMKAAVENVNNPVETPDFILFDSLTNLGDVIQWMVAPAGGQLSQPQWGEMARRALSVVTFFRGLQRRGMIRVFNCTSGWTKDDQQRTTQELFIGTGGQQAPKHVRRFIDLMFHVESFYAPDNPEAGEDGIIRRFHTCEHDGIVAKGHPKLRTPWCPANWATVVEAIMGTEFLKRKVGDGNRES